LKIRGTGDGGRGTGDRVWIEVQNGLGQELGEGAVKPHGQPLAAISIPLTVFEARKMGFACLAYLQAWEVGRILQKAVISNQ